MNIACLITCHNRSEKTLACLNALADAMRQVESQVGVGKWIVHVFLVDDGSTDGTSKSVQDWTDQLKGKGDEQMTLHLICGGGSLYWAKGMALAWREALKCEKNLHSTPEPPVSASFTHFLWLNDDVILRPDAIVKLLDDEQRCGFAEAVVVGACSTDAAETKSSYSATNRSDEQLVPNGKFPQRADGWFNGNVVLVPRAVYEKVGIISDTYSHGRADYDYAERLKRANIPFFVSSNYSGFCVNDGLARVKCLNRIERLKRLITPSNTNIFDLWKFRIRYYGFVRAICSCVHLIYIAVKGLK